MLFVIVNALLGFVGALFLSGNLLFAPATTATVVLVSKVHMPFCALVAAGYVVAAASVCSWEVRREAGACGQPLFPPTGTPTWFVLTTYWLILTAATALVSNMTLADPQFPVKVGDGIRVAAGLLIPSTLSVGVLALRLRQLRSKSLT